MYLKFQETVHPFIDLYKGFSGGKKKKKNKKKRKKNLLNPFLFWGFSIFFIFENYLKWKVSECLRAEWKTCCNHLLSWYS